ncbi:MAG: bifunctional methylenetetrahydrofolate dehydrogenase/methenyltetrahydrofolate cyclohydrolase FolD, partial [Candidatus Competibacteraceae bacterium]|nr:bifunctional methylenetetrahydrofolate dehydrogenase/methenyltetrahydrofolate cyclohydrolase FolD [Candidatus Competibacteraceae bacterium]
DEAASRVYVGHRRQACDRAGFLSQAYDLPASIGQEQLLELIDRLNHNEEIDGILVQLPLPEHIDAETVIERIDPTKDVDGFHPYNMGRLAVRLPGLRPCTSRGIMALLDSTGLDLRGRHGVVVGASNIVGRPLALELLLAGCTVTVCHRFTQDLAQQVNQGEIVAAATGVPGLIKGDWIKSKAVVVDVGITRRPDGRLAGDVEFQAARQRAAWITPVPGGVGPMTVATLLLNTLEAAQGRLDG